MADDNYYVEPLPPRSPSNTSTVQHTGVIPSSIPLCRIFLIIVASFIIGGVVGGTISYLWTSGEGPHDSCSEITLSTDTSHCSCPTCQTCENVSATDPAEPEWQLVFKAVAGVANPQETDRLLIDPYKIWESDTPYNENVPEAKQLDTSFRGHYKSSFSLNWQRIREVKVGLFDEAGNELISLIFDGECSNRTNWFSKDRLLSSPWIDLYTEPQNRFTSGSDHVEGARGSIRRWYINRNHGGCPADAGWFAVISILPGYCDWENGGSKDDKPLFLYSKGDTYTNWNIEQNVGEADIFAIFVKTY